MRHAFAGKVFLAGNIQAGEARTGGHDQRPGPQLAGVGDHHPVVTLQTHRRHLGQLHLHAKAHRLLLQQRTQGIAGHPVREAGIVLDVLAVEDLAAGREALQQDGPAAVPSRVHAGAESGRPAADDDDVVGLSHSHTP